MIDFCSFDLTASPTVNRVALTCCRQAADNKHHISCLCTFVLYTEGYHVLRKSRVCVSLRHFAHLLQSQHSNHCLTAAIRTSPTEPVLFKGAVLLQRRPFVQHPVTVQMVPGSQQTPNVCLGAAIMLPDALNLLHVTRPTCINVF